MKVEFVASDGKRFATEAECLQHEQKSPLFRAYDADGRPVEVGEGVYLVHIIEKDEGGEAFVRLCEERKELSTGISRYSNAGWYWWGSGHYSRVDEDLVRAMMRARYNVEPTD